MFIEYFIRFFDYEIYNVINLISVFVEDDDCIMLEEFLINNDMKIIWKLCFKNKIMIQIVVSYLYMVK